MAALGLVLMVGGIITLPCLYLVVHHCRAAIIADEEGLRWRGVCRWRAVPWEEVTDYHYKTPPSSGYKTETYHIETPLGKMQFHDKAWTQTEQLRNCVVQYATAARAQYWGVKYERPEDWPMVFHYDTKFNRAAPRELVILHVVSFAAVLFWFGYEWVMTHTLPAWGWLLTPTGLFLVAKEVALAVMHSRFRDTYRRLEQQITVFDDGLVFEDGERRVETDWGGVSDFYSNGWRHIVVTEQGDFDFLATLNNSEVLKREIAYRAYSANQAWWGRTGPLTKY